MDLVLTPVYSNVDLEYKILLTEKIWRRHDIHIHNNLNAYL
jgi:hypothetical protein